MITHTICAFTSTGRNRRKGSGVLPSGRAHVGVQGAQSVGRHSRQELRGVPHHARIHAVPLLRTDSFRFVLRRVQREEQLGYEQGEIVRFGVLRGWWCDDEAFHPARAGSPVFHQKAHVQHRAQDEGERGLNVFEINCF